MKTKNWIMLLVAVMVMATVSYAQGEAPADVTDALMAKYETAQITGAKSIDANKWTVNFSDSFGEHRAQISSSGEWLNTQSDIDLATLPTTISTALANSYSSYIAYKAAKYDSPTMKGYAVKLRKDRELIEVLLDKEGNLIKPSTLDDSKQ